MKYHFFASGFIFSALAVSACGSSSSSGLSDDAACAKLAAARCERVGTCNADGIEVRYGDLATCQSAQKAACMNSLAASSTGATPTTANACADALPGVACSDYNNNLLPVACQPAVGKLAAGAACAFSAQCQSQFCGIDKNASCGVCQPQPQVNDSCASLDSCGPGLTCVAKGTVCAAENPKVGDICDADTPCGSGFSCVGSKAATATAAAVSGACQPAVASAGAACDSKKKTGPGCDPAKGLTCDPTSMLCIAAVVASAGQACDGDLTVCAAAATCVIPTGATMGTCVAPAADGAACDTANGPGCLTLSRCIITGTGTSGTCELAIDKCGAGTAAGAAGASAVSSGGASGAGGAGGSGGSGITPL